MKQHEPQYKCASWLSHFIDPRKAKVIVEKAVRILRQYEFEAIAFRGVSGALIAPLIAMEMGKSLIVVRKSSESAHSRCMVEGDCAVKRFVIVDDFIDSGDTVRAILNEVDEFAPDAKCVGMLHAYYLGKGTNVKYASFGKAFITEPIEQWEYSKARKAKEAQCKTNEPTSTDPAPSSPETTSSWPTTTSESSPSEIVLRSNLSGLGKTRILKELVESTPTMSTEEVVTSAGQALRTQSLSTMRKAMNTSIRDLTVPIKWEWNAAQEWKRFEGPYQTREMPSQEKESVRQSLRRLASPMPMRYIAKRLKVSRVSKPLPEASKASRTKSKRSGS